MEPEMISKKDLLRMTGISYGQLYRWKRENLIPEEWFVKRSSTTGQETFFPREAMLQRVRDILELKDRYPLEELARRLAPEQAGVTYRTAGLWDKGILPRQAATLLQNIPLPEFLDFRAIGLLHALSVALESGVIAEELFRRLLAGQGHFLQQEAGLSRLFVIEAAQARYVLLLPREPRPAIDPGLRVVWEHDVEEKTQEIKRRLNL